MANFGVNFASALEGLGEGFEQGQRMGLRQLQSRKLKREEEFNKELAAGDPTAKPKEKGWLGQLGDAALSLFRRAQPSDSPPPGAMTVTGGQTSTLDVKREPNVQGAGGVVPPAPGGQFGVRPDQQEVGEGTSRSAFGYQPGDTSTAIPPSPTGDVQGSSGAVPPPGRTAAPSPQARAIAGRAVVQAGGRPSASSTDVEGPGAAAAAGQPSYGPSAYRTYPGAPAGEQTEWNGQPQGVVPLPGGAGPARPMVGREPPGGSPQGPAQPLDEQSRYPRDVGATARTVGGPNRTQLSPQEEQQFQQWYRDVSSKTGVNPNPDDPRHHYDWRGAYKAGATPVKDPTDGLPHWPSQFKDPDHPNRFVGGVDTITGEQVSRAETRQQGYAPGAVKLGPETPPGAIPTPQDQKRDADAIKLANQPKPPGQQPPDLIKAITTGKPDGTLPSQGDLQRYIDKIPALMKIDPERALRLQAGIFEALRTGTQHGFMQAQIALETGDMTRAQQILMQTYNKYITPVAGNYAQFDVSKDGKSMTMQGINAQTGQPDGKPIPVTQEMMTKLTLMATDPKAFAQWLHWKDQIDVTKRGQDVQAGSAAASRAQQDKQFTLKFNEDKRQFDLRMQEETRRNDLAEKREGRVMTMQERAADLHERVAKDQIDDRQRKLAMEKNQRTGDGYWDPPQPERTRIIKDITEEFDTRTPTDKTQAAQWTKNKGVLTSTAFDLMAHNSNMLAAQALELSQRLTSGENATVVDKRADSIRYKLGDTEFTMPLSADRRTTVQPRTPPAGAPPAAGGQGVVPPQPAAGGAPSRASGLPVPEPKRIEPQPTLGAYDIKRGQRDTTEAEVRRGEQALQQERRGANAAAQQLLPDYAQRLVQYGPRDRERALASAVNEIVAKTKADPGFVRQQLLNRLNAYSTPQPGVPGAPAMAR